MTYRVAFLHPLLSSQETSITRREQLALSASKKSKKGKEDDDEEDAEEKPAKKAKKGGAKSDSKSAGKTPKPKTRAEKPVEADVVEAEVVETAKHDESTTARKRKAPARGRTLIRKHSRRATMAKMAKKKKITKTAGNDHSEIPDKDEVATAAPTKRLIGKSKARPSKAPVAEPKKKKGAKPATTHVEAEEKEEEEEDVKDDWPEEAGNDYEEAEEAEEAEGDDNEGEREEEQSAGPITFARRYCPARAYYKAKWESLRVAYNERVRPFVYGHVKMEDTRKSFHVHFISHFLFKPFATLRFRSRMPFGGLSLPKTKRAARTR